MNNGLTKAKGVWNAKEERYYWFKPATPEVDVWILRWIDDTWDIWYQDPQAMFSRLTRKLFMRWRTANFETGAWRTWPAFIEDTAYSVFLLKLHKDAHLSFSVFLPSSLSSYLSHSCQVSDSFTFMHTEGCAQARPFLPSMTQQKKKYTHTQSHTHLNCYLDVVFFWYIIITV